MSGRGDDREAMYGGSLEGQLDLLEKENASLKRKLAMQSDLDLQGYEHPRDELQELRDKLEAAGKNGRELSASCCPFLNNNGLYSDEYGHTRCHAKERVKALEDALRAIADGRGMVRDKSTIYMNGRTPEVPAIFNKHDMQEIAKIVLEATCQSI